MRRLSLCLLLCFILVAGALPVAAQGVLDKAGIEAHLKDLMTAYNVPGVAVAMIQDGKVVYENGLGVRSTASKEPVTANTLFAIGSITKSFTALAIMQLVEAGKLDLDTPVIKYLPDFKLSDADATKTVTLRNLLSHTSGLPRSDEWVFDESITREQVIKDVASIKLTAKPGELWQYSNQNYVLAGAVLEKVTGQSWETYVKTNLFDPLGLKTANTDVAVSQKAPDFALPHRLNVPGGMEPIPFRGLQAIGPAGSINASIQDMAQYALFQLGDGTFDGKTIVKQPSLDEMHKKQAAIPSAGGGGPVTAESYGFGWVQETYRGVDLVEHDGAINGFYADISLVPSKKAATVVLTNADAAVAFTDVARLRLLDDVLGLPEEDYSSEYNKALGFDPATFAKQMAAARSYKPALKEFDALLGDLDGPLGNLPVSLKEGKLFITQTVGQSKVDIELVPFDHFQFLSNGTQAPWIVFHFEVDDQGTVKLYQGTILIGQRLGAGVKEVEFKDPAGHFTFTVPNPLVAQEANGLVVMISVTPKATFVIDAIKAEGTDLKANLERWFSLRDPNAPKQEPVNVRDVPLPGGLKWTQYIYQLPSAQLLVVLAVQQGDSVYFVSVTAATQDVQSLAPALNKILLSFTPAK